jgi:hypothetical protein
MSRDAERSDVTRLLSSIRTRRTEQSTAPPAEGQEAPRKVVLGSAAFVTGVLVGSTLARGAASSGGLRRRAGAALPGDAVDVPIGGSDGEGNGHGGGDADRAGDATTEGADESAGSALDDQAVTGSADPSLEEVDERTGPDVDEEPAEPGEMQVDDDVVEEAVDGDESKLAEGRGRKAEEGEEEEHADEDESEE